MTLRIFITFIWQWFNFTFREKKIKCFIIQNYDKIKSNINENKINNIYNEINIVNMKSMLDNFVDGIITSPPIIHPPKRDYYYNTMGYSEIDNLSSDEYLRFENKWI